MLWQHALLLCNVVVASIVLGWLLSIQATVGCFWLWVLTCCDTHWLYTFPVPHCGGASRRVLPCSDVEAIDAEDKQDLVAFPFDEEAEFRGLGDALPVGEKGFTTLERRYTPSHNINDNK